MIILIYFPLLLGRYERFKPLRKNLVKTMNAIINMLTLVTSNVGELLLIKRDLQVIKAALEDRYRVQIFHSRCTIG